MEHTVPFNIQAIKSSIARHSPFCGREGCFSGLDSYLWLLLHALDAQLQQLDVILLCWVAHLLVSLLITAGDANTLKGLNKAFCMLQSAARPERKHHHLGPVKKTMHCAAGRCILRFVKQSEINCTAGLLNLTI